MRRRLDLAASLVVTPWVLFLDEPTTGLDPRSRLALWDVVRELASSGTTILLTTQYLEEADRLADRIALLDKGRIVAEGTPAELKARVAGARLELVLADSDAFEQARRRLDGRAAYADADLRTIGVDIDGSVQSVRAVLDDLSGTAVAVESLSVGSPSLDDVYFALTGHATQAQETRPHV